MNNQAFSKIWVAVIIVVLLAGGILAWQYFGALKEEVKVPGEKTPKKVTEDKTIDWKTYTNEDYGFKIKYPKDWNLIQKSASYIRLDVKGKTQPYAPYAGSGAIEIDDIDIRVDSYPILVIEGGETAHQQVGRYLELDEWLENEVRNNTYENKSEITIGNYKGVQVVDNTLEKIFTRIFLIHNSYLYIFIVPTHYLEEAPFNQMLSTFRFIEDATADWKSYNGKYFSFKYPNNWVEETGPAVNYWFNLEIIGLRISPNAVFEASYQNYSYEENIQRQGKSEKLTVAGREAMKFRQDGAGEVLPVGFSIISVVIKGSEGRSYNIVFNGDRKDITEELINQMLSTFRFLE